MVVKLQKYKENFIKKSIVEMSKIVDVFFLKLLFCLIILKVKGAQAEICTGWEVVDFLI